MKKDDPATGAALAAMASSTPPHTSTQNNPQTTPPTMAPGFPPTMLPSYVMAQMQQIQRIAQVSD